MSETVNQEKIETNEQPKAEKQEKLFTQEEVNGFFNKRYSTVMSQLEEYKAKAEKFDALEEANKSELQKATEQAEKYKSELESLKKAEEIRAVRDKISQETGVPSNLLSGEDEEACKAQAAAIKEYASTGRSYPSIKDGGEVNVNHVGKPSTKQQFAEWAAAAFK